jgi:hypothetical protein
LHRLIKPRGWQIGIGRDPKAGIELCPALSNLRAPLAFAALRCTGLAIGLHQAIDRIALFGGEPLGAQYITLLIVVLIVVLIWLLFGSVMGGSSQLPQPTPTLGLPTGIIFSRASPLGRLGLICLLKLRATQWWQELQAHFGAHVHLVVPAI